MPLLGLTGEGAEKRRVYWALRGQSIGSGVTPNILIGLVTIMVHCTMLVFHGGRHNSHFGDISEIKNCF